jgi:tryptophanyl-tRNA synthetase
MLAPVQERYAQLRGDEARLDELLAAGADRAHALAAPVVADVRDAMGFGTTR